MTSVGGPIDLIYLFEHAEVIKTKQTKPTSTVPYCTYCTVLVQYRVVAL